MKTIHRSHFPVDHHYYRTSSSIYRQYLDNHCSIQTLPIESTGQFGWMKKLIGKRFQLAKFERIDIEPTREFLSAHGFHHGMVIWIPHRRTDIPTGWRKLWAATHFTRTGFVTIDAREYWKKWNERARRARKRFLAAEKARIELVTPDIFIDAFQKTKVKHLFKSDYIKYYRQMTGIDPASIRSYVCYLEDKPVAGLAVHDYGENSSVHLVAFTDREAKSIQGGTGLIDRWFADSLAKGVRYISFDHLRDSSMTSDQQGYTDFKTNFIEHECYFRESYFRFM